MFILFGTTCATALLTPVFLTRAYQIQEVTVSRTISISPKTIRGHHLRNFARPSIQAAAMGPWVLKASVLDIYNSSLFTPPSQPRDASSQPLGFFFANDIGNANATLSGLHLNGSCVPMSPADIHSTGLDVDTMGADTSQALKQFCKSNIPHFQGDSRTPIVTDFNLQLPEPAFLHVLLQACSNVTGASSDTSQIQNVGYFYYRYTVDPDQVPERGLIRCLSNFTTGFANVSGLDRTYTEFRRQSLFEVNSTQGSTQTTVADIDPMYLTFDAMSYTLNTTTAGYTLQDGLITAGLGFTYVENGDRPYIASPSAKDIASNLWGAIVHSVAAVGVLSKDDNTGALNATVTAPIAVYTRSRPEALGAYVLLALWLALIIGITAWGYRRTFSHNLNSYVAAELIARERGLLEDVPIGGAGDNSNLRKQFKPLDLQTEENGKMGLESEKLRRSETGSSY
ncbi:hypothetical protein V5O48_008381 [Marasmius crinis-equi]|uniref:Uncharacterized protein n=1 Tax=Marasmius crinis-equi TaxID=585013 RepID=A0ABR3FE59_9AGAR